MCELKIYEMEATLIIHDQVRTQYFCIQGGE